MSKIGFRFFQQKKGKTGVLPPRIASQFSLVSHYITSIFLYIKRWTILVLDSPSFLHFLIDVFYFVSVFSIFPHFYRQAAFILFITSLTYSSGFETFLAISGIDISHSSYNVSIFHSIFASFIEFSHALHISTTSSLSSPANFAPVIIFINSTASFST